jgi:hypothetical protein
MTSPAMTPSDFTLDAVPLRGPLAPIAALLGDGDGVFVDAGDGEGWWARIGDPPAPMPRQPREGWVWTDAGWCWLQAPISRLTAADLVTSPAARSAVVAWLEEQGYTAAYRGDEALLIALRHVCGLPPAPPSVDDCDTDDIPF